MEVARQLGQWLRWSLPAPADNNKAAAYFTSEAFAWMIFIITFFVFLSFVLLYS